MKREFYIENAKGQQYSLMDLKSYCFFSSPKGLGYSYKTEYAQIGDNFIENIRKLDQGLISGELIFKSYDNYKNFIDFVENTEGLKFVYKVPYNTNPITYYKDVSIQSIDKTEKGTDQKLHCPVTFNSKSLWYEQNEVVYTITTLNNEVRWDFRFDSRFISYNNRNIIFENKGHTEAPIKVEMDGYLINPSILIRQNDKDLYKLDLDLTIEQGEKLLYCTKDTDLYIYKKSTDGTLTNLFETLDLNNINFFKLPKGVSEISLSADNNITSAKLIIYVEYK